MAIISRFLAGFSRAHVFRRIAVALNSFRPAVSWIHAASTVSVYKRLFAVAFGWRRALSYYHAAQLDEKEGFPFTAAMEWRMAAELFNFVPIARQRCWGEWERIMHLPQRLATPIFAGDVITLLDTSVCNRKKPATAVKDALSARQREPAKEGAPMQLEISWHNPVPPRKIKSSAQKAASKNNSAVCAIPRFKPEEEVQLLDGAA